MKSYRVYMLFLLVFFISTATLQAQSPQTAAASESPAVRRAREIIQLINSGSRAEGRKYVQEQYSPTFLGNRLEQHVEFFSRAHDWTRGLDIAGVPESKPGEAMVPVRNRLTGRWINLLVRTEAAEPYRVTGVGMRPGKAPAGQKPIKLTPAQMADELDSLVTKLGRADLFSGAVLLAKDGKVIYKNAAGLANKDFNAANRVDTKFNLGSMNKMFTSVAIAQLVERGKLSFDDPLSKFLPDFPDKESAAKIQIKHLLTHTAGLGSYFNQKFWESSRASYRTVNDMMELAKAEKLQFEPGSRWQYSNTGMLVLGAVIEKATGQSYFDYIRENIYKVAGMTNTDCYELDRVNPNLAVGYEKSYTDDGIYFRNNVFSHVIRGGPAGGGYSTVEDLLKFDVALRSNKLVGANYVKMLLSAKPEMNSPNYGFGFSVDTENQIVGHSGGFEGISSNLDMFLSNGYTAIVMSNYGGGSQPFSDKMKEMILAANEGQTAKK